MSNMKLVAYSDDTFSSKVAGGEYELMLNPDKLRWERRNQYNEETGLGSKTSPRYSKTQSEKLSFDIVIDCTGVVDSTRTDLPTDIANLSKVVYTYNGRIHRPNYVIVNWGKGLAFKCVLTSFDLSYTFFKPDGTPLRAKISLAFSSYLDPATMARMEGKQSPDMTHLIHIVDGDDLPNISRRIYGSTQYYVQLAQFNGLNKFRHLRAGTALTVPPLIAGGASDAQ